jgi:hypothetical protein
MELVVILVITLAFAVVANKIAQVSQRRSQEEDYLRERIITGITKE